MEYLTIGKRGKIYFYLFDIQCFECNYNDGVDSRNTR